MYWNNFAIFCIFLPHLFNENRSCIEIYDVTSLFPSRMSLMKTEVVLKLEEEQKFLIQNFGLMKTEVVLKFIVAVIACYVV